MLLPFKNISDVTIFLNNYNVLLSVIPNVVVLSNLFVVFCHLIPHFSLQPGCDPMTAPVPVPMLLFPHQVRWIYPSLNSLGTVFVSAVRQKKRDRKSEEVLFHLPFFVTRPKECSWASKVQANRFVAGGEMSSREAERLYTKKCHSSVKCRDSQ